VEITVKQMMQIEENGHQMGFLKKFMMENAGASAVRRLKEKFENLSSKKILIFAGLGNNGGDALVIARHLVGHGSKVTVVLLGEPEKIKTEESKWNWELLSHSKSINFIKGSKEIKANLPGLESLEDDVIIDGILGTGISGTIREPYASAIKYINDSKAFKLAVDVPSGLDPDTGNTSNIFVKADFTITFHKMKIGMPKRKDLCGKIFVEKIGIPPEAEDGVL